MRTIQIILLFLGLIAFLLALSKPLEFLGLVYYRAGIGILILDIVLILLWPKKS